MTKLQLQNYGNRRYLLRIIVPKHPFDNVFSRVASRTTPLGPINVATAANKAFPDWDVEVIDENNFRGQRDNNELPDHNFLQKLRSADVVGFYAGLTSTMPRLFALAKYYKSQGTITIAGGDHVCQLPDEALSNGIDIVARGEGELVIVEIIKALIAGNGLDHIKGISFESQGVFVHNQPKRIDCGNLNYLPCPDFGLLHWAKPLSFYPICRTHGCSRRCEFCTINYDPRWSSAEHLLEQVLNQTRTNKKAKYFFIVDDRLNEDQAGTEEFFRLVIMAKEDGTLPEKVKFIVQIRLESARELEFLKLMRQAGVIMVCIGYESPIAAELNAMRKGIKPSDMIAYTKVFKNLGFWVHAMFMFGYPGDKEIISVTSKERERQFKDFIKQAGPDTIQVLAPTPIPGTDFYNRLAAQNRIYPREYFGWELYDGNHVVFEPDAPMTALEVQKSIMNLMKWFYSFWNFGRLALIVLSFPFVVPFSFNYWHRLWRHRKWGFLGHGIIRRWLKVHKRSNFLQKLAMVKSRLLIR